MTPVYATEAAITDFITKALEEDVGNGDHSTLAVIPQSAITTAKLLAKDHGIIAGLALAEKVLEIVSNNIKMTWHKVDGDSITPGDVVLTAVGPAQALLTAERLVLNIIQRMSGIATYTNQLCKLIEGTGASLMDTRKTTPNFRIAEKWAVAIGGGTNHRFALYDMIMLKDNHIDVSGGITNAVSKAVAYNYQLPERLLIEVETRTLSEVEEALNTGQVDRIMLDNMSLEEMRKAVQVIDGQCETEASGNITEANLKSVAACGVNYISVGALTHAARSLDLSLKMSGHPL